MRIGLFFGSFNPIHNGHIILAQYIQQHYQFHEVWFVISPKSPFKTQHKMLHHHERLHLIHLAIDHIPELKTSTIEFDLPEPHYTINTLAHLFEKYPQHTFSIIMGKDNLNHFHKWKNYEQILNRVQVLVYPRLHQHQSIFDNHPQVILTQAPVIEISSSIIRELIKVGKTPSAMLHPKVWEEIQKSGHYRE
jgi:nicotinate-nucleotide adenylyltransferase